MRTIAFLSILAVQCLIAGSAAAQVTRCVVNGVVTYQDSPCESADKTPRKEPAVTRRSPEPASNLNFKKMADQMNADVLKAMPQGKEASFPSAEVPGSGMTQAQVCRAAIAALMGQDLVIVKAYREEASQNAVKDHPADVRPTTYVGYIRPSDRTHWEYKCRVLGKQVFWGMSTGRWRDSPADSAMLFERTGGSIVIRQVHTDASANSRSFPIVEL